MSRTLVSWRASKNDFLSGGAVNLNGPNAQVHQRHWKYDRHILLSTARPKGSPHAWQGEAEEREQTRLLAGALEKRFEHEVEVRELGIRDVIDFPSVRARVESLLVGLADDEIDIFVSPGTGTMQTAWYFAHFGLGLQTRLFKLREAEFTPEGHGSELVYEEVDQSPVPQSLTIREQKTEAVDTDILRTKSIRAVYDRASRVAATDNVTALVLGPSGSGKEDLARTIHAESARQNGPFVAINCAAWQNDQILESRLFGHEKGAFTGADRSKPGAFEDAEGGTLFLDEIGDCSLALQRSLLRVLQEREVVHLGSTDPIHVDVRVVAATHRDLAERCESGAFRWDLYYRLAVAELEVPSLHERGTDEIEEMLNHFVALGQTAFRRPEPLAMSAAAKAAVLAYAFPGNVRELKHLVDRLYVFCDGTAELDDLPPRVRAPEGPASLKLRDVEQRHVLSVYERFGSNKTRAAAALGCSVNTLKSRLRAYEDEAGS